MNRADLQYLSTVRLVEAKALFAAGFHSGAYYLAGYALECAIKACIAKSTALYDFPNKQRAEEAYKHAPDALIRAAGLQEQLKATQRGSHRFSIYWNVCKAWSEQSRYTLQNASQADDLIRALEDEQDGVLQWINQYW